MKKKNESKIKLEFHKQNIKQGKDFKKSINLRLINNLTSVREMNFIHLPKNENKNVND